MDSQHLRGLGLIPFVLLERPLKEALLKFTDRILIVHFVFDHLINESVELIFQGKAPPRVLWVYGVIARDRPAGLQDGLSKSLKSGVEITLEAAWHYEGNDT